MCFTFSDPRVDDYFMMSSITPGIIVTILYVIAVEWAIPKYMENRKPYEMRTFMLVYNFAMVLLSGYTFLEVILLAGYTLKEYK